MKKNKNNRLRTVTAFLLSFCFAFLVFGFAISQSVPSVSSFSDTISTSRPEKDASHEIQFTANGTIPSGGRIEIFFEDNFEIHENLSYEEISFFINDSQVELGSESGAENFGIDIDREKESKVSVTVADNAVIDDDDVIRIEIGKGSRKIENPSEAGTYEIHAKVFNQQEELINKAKTLIAIIEAVDVATSETPQIITGEPEVLGRKEVILEGELFDLAGIGSADLFFEYRVQGIEEGDLEDHPDHSQEEGDWVETEKFGREDVVTYTEHITDLEPGTYYEYRAVMEWVNSPLHKLTGLTKEFLTEKVEDDDPEEDDEEEGEPGDEPPPDEGEPAEGEDEPGDPDPPPPGSESDPGDQQAAPPPPELQNPPPYIVFSGWAYPGSDLALLMDGEEIQTAEANQSGGFSLEINEPHSGKYDFTVVQKDDDGKNKEEISTNMEVDPETVTAVLDNIFPPTIELDQSQIASGEEVNISGMSTPDGEVEVRFRGSGDDITKTVEPDSDGDWELNLSYDDLEKGSYDVQARLNIFDENSFYGEAVNLSVGETSADLNSDGSINLTDFSILMHHWGTSSSEGDINNDGTVDLTDFSIMMDSWTG